MDASSVPTITVTRDDLAADARVSTLLVRSGQCTSQTDARKQILQNAVSVNGEKVTDPAAVITADQFSGDGLALKKGKKSFCLVVLK